MRKPNEMKPLAVTRANLEKLARDWLGDAYVNHQKSIDGLVKALAIESVRRCASHNNVNVRLIRDALLKLDHDVAIEFE
jgi:hypothetical protein